jgi:hypothetical protein
MQSSKIDIGDILKHYKGGVYFVLGIIKRESDLETLITYMDLKSKVIYARPLSEFDDMVNGYLPRFSKVSISSSQFVIE